LLKSRWAARQKIAMLRTAYAMTASATLKSALSDLAGEPEVCLGRLFPRRRGTNYAGNGMAHSASSPGENLGSAADCTSAAGRRIERGDVVVDDRTEGRRRATVFDRQEAQQIHREDARIHTCVSRSSAWRLTICRGCRLRR
jgi:hypothetical protein